ncbi:LysR family transcriptional regulator [Megasphaera vaginalis (ex Bordigoni et al. 2020)]|uniref:LysR family transcriptional regulator n=1 Tax=Megasphaera vaginalis (ex Bordigoni et al. 2020) TaxID=2045301 RepID=UPI000C7D3A14|nr:LysR family transcriptional regulator [Megasphaera vaginalis (ex Bordigoni et al. 2020)]
MDTITLRTFITLAQIKNFTKTAQQLFVAQSTVTNRIRDLESELGTALFTRNHKQVELTREGNTFLDYAQRFVELEIKALQELQLAPAYTRQIRLGTTNTIYECHLQKKLLAYLTAKPPVSVEITISHTKEMLEMLQSGLLDAVFSFTSLYKEGFICRPYHCDTMHLVCAAANDEYRNGIYQRDLQTIDYLFCNFALQGVGLYIRDLFPKHHRFPIEIDNSTKLPQYVAAGLGYTFLPESLIEEELIQRRLRSIPLLDFAPPQVDSYYITRNPNTVPQKLEQALLL